MVADYYVIRRGFIDIPSLYHTHVRGGEKSNYLYTCGFSIKAYVAYLCGVAVNMTGFVGICQGHYVNENIDHMYTLAYPIGFCVAFVLYLFLHAPHLLTAFRTRTPLGWYEPAGSSWEANDWSAPVHQIISDTDGEYPTTEAHLASGSEDHKGYFKNNDEEKPVSVLY